MSTIMRFAWQGYATNPAGQQCHNGGRKPKRNGEDPDRKFYASFAQLDDGHEQSGGESQAEQRARELTGYEERQDESEPRSHAQRQHDQNGTEGFSRELLRGIQHAPRGQHSLVEKMESVPKVLRKVCSHRRRRHASWRGL